MATSPSQIRGDQVFADNVRFLEPPTVPDGSFGDDEIADGAGIKAEKLEHQHRANFAQPNTTAAAEVRSIYTCFGAAGLVIGVKAGSLAKCTGDSTVTIDVQKADGTSVLASTIVLNNANTNGLPVDGTLHGTLANLTVAENTMLKVVITVSAGTGTLATGVFVSVTVEEDSR